MSNPKTGDESENKSKLDIYKHLYLNSQPKSRDNKANGKERVLVVDDEAGVLYVTTKILTDHNYQVTAVSSAEEALELVKEQGFELVVSDIAMPGMNGLEFLEALKRCDPLITPVVITGSSTALMAVQAIKSGAQGFVPKPFTKSELIETIQTALQESRLMRENLEMKLYMPLLEKTNAALLNAMEAKDQDSQGHSQRVAEITLRLAAELGVSEEKQTQFYFGALFHDIGKIGVSDTILKKTEGLTPEEILELRRHPEIGAHIISTSKGMEEAALFIRHHHEWYDGSGYPNGLKGEEIPLGSRIIAVVDAYEDLMHPHSHSETTTLEEAIAKLVRGKGTQFDPKVVDCFVAHLNSASVNYLDLIQNDSQLLSHK